MRIVLLAIASTALLFGSSKSELELRAKLAASQAQVAAKAKENSALQDSLKAAATASAQLAAALRDKKALQASLDALAAKDKAQQDSVRAAAQVAAQAAGQLAAQAATLAAAKSRTELKQALATAAANNKHQANVAAQQRNDAAATTDANAAEAQRVAAESKAAGEKAADKAADVAQGQKRQGEEVLRLTAHTDFASYASLIAASSGIVIFVVGQWFTNRANVRVAAIQASNAERDHRWLVESTAAAAKEAREHRTLELAKIDEVKTASKAAEVAANTVNAKIASIGLKVADDTPLKPEDVIKA